MRKAVYFFDGVRHIIRRKKGNFGKSAREPALAGNAEFFLKVIFYIRNRRDFQNVVSPHKTPLKNSGVAIPFSIPDKAKERHQKGEHFRHDDGEPDTVDAVD